MQNPTETSQRKRMKEVTARSVLGGWKPRGASLGSRQESTSSVGGRSGEELAGSTEQPEARREGGPRRDRQRGRSCAGTLGRHPRGKTPALPNALFNPERYLRLFLPYLCLHPFDTSPLVSRLLGLFT